MKRNQLTVKNRILWIDGIKFFACIGVFWGHFFGAYKTVEAGRIFKVLMILTRGIIDGGFWVAVFCIISGIFAGMKNIMNLKELTQAIVHRYFRFVIPLVPLYLIIWAVSLTIGFKSYPFGVYFGNEWLAEAYKEELYCTSAIISALRLDASFNSTLWTIRSIFFGTCIVYFCNYITRKMSKKAQIIIRFVMFVLLLFMQIKYAHGFLYVGGVVLGSLFFDISVRVKHLSHKIMNLILLVLIFLCSGGHEFIFNWISNFINIPEVFNYYGYERMLYAFLFLIILSLSHSIRELLEKNGIKKLYSISFSVYLVHWPIICSCSLTLFYVLSQYDLNGDVILGFTFVLTNVIVLTVGELFHIMEEKLYEKINNYKHKLMRI